MRSRARPGGGDLPKSVWYYHRTHKVSYTDKYGYLLPDLVAQLSEIGLLQVLYTDFTSLTKTSIASIIKVSTFPLSPEKTIAPRPGAVLKPCLTIENMGSLRCKSEST